jgi:hypothetical protein
MKNYTRPLFVRVVVWVAVMLVGAAHIIGQGQRRVPPGPPAIEGGLRTSETTILVNTSMPAPAWALAERELLRLNAEGAALWAGRYLDPNGHLRGEPHFGILDGPDDAVETIRNWPLAHALGGPDSIIELWDRVWEGHIDQYSRASDPSTDLAKYGMYHKEFPGSYDWEHIGEGLGPFYWYGLSRPTDDRYRVRMRRFAGFYMNEDPEARNYDPKLKMIPSLFNGSRGAKLTPNTQEDWNGRVLPGTKPSTRFLKATNIRGDHPLNLSATNLALHAYMLTHEDKYRNWLLEYVDAWKARIAANGGNIPSNIGVDGTIGGEWGGKWYGGVFGWNSPDEGVRNYVLRGPPEAFGNALLLTGDQGYTQVMRRQIDNLYAAARVEYGRTLVPRYYGDNGWYGHHDGETGSAGGLLNLRNVEIDVYLWGFAPGDLKRLPRRGETVGQDLGWIDFLETGDAAYPFASFQRALEEVRAAAARVRADDNTYNFPPHATRGAVANPVATTALVNMTLGGNDPGGSTHGPLPLHTQVRHFDPERRRAGLPEDVAALVERIRPESVTLTLVNINPFEPRTVTVQMGAYAEHLASTVRVGEREFQIDAPYFSVRLAPGAGHALTIGVRRYAHQPTLAFPWDRGWMVKR